MTSHKLFTFGGPPPPPTVQFTQPICTIIKFWPTPLPPKCLTCDIDIMQAWPAPYNARGHRAVLAGRAAVKRNCLTVFR